MLGENRFKDGTLEFPVAVDGDIAETDHFFHGLSSTGSKQSPGLEEIKGVTTALRDTQPLMSDAVHGVVDCGFAGPQKIENDGVLDGEIVQTAGVAAELFPDSGEATPDDGCFVECRIIDHVDGAVKKIMKDKL